MEVLWPSSSTRASWPWVMQAACSSSAFCRQSGSSLMVRLRASSGEMVLRLAGSARLASRTAARNTFRRERAGGAVEILRGAYEGAWPRPHRAHDGLEVAAGLGRQEHQHLLRVLGRGHRQAVLALLAPGLGLEEPALGR